MAGGLCQKLLQCCCKLVTAIHQTEKKALFCCYLPANSVENKSEDLQISTEAEMEAGEVELSNPKSVTEADKVTEPVKMVETPSKGTDNPASLQGNSDTIMLF